MLACMLACAYCKHSTADTPVEPSPPPEEPSPTDSKKNKPGKKEGTLGKKDGGPGKKGTQVRCTMQQGHDMRGVKGMNREACCKGHAVRSRHK